MSADLRVENPKTIDDFRKALADAEVCLPLVLNSDEPGVIFDAEGELICVVDVNNVRGDEDVDLIASWIILAVNTCGGYRAEIAS